MWRVCPFTLVGPRLLNMSTDVWPKCVCVPDVRMSAYISLVAVGL